MSIPSVGFIGAGKIATALARGFLAAQVVTKDRIMASAPTLKSLANIGRCGVVTTCDNKETVRNSRVVLVAVKPHVVARVLKDVSEEVTQDHVFISVAAGVTLATLGKNLPAGTRIVRCMPNTPVLVQNGVTVYAMNENGAEKGDRAIVEDLLRSVGICEEMDEYYMDIITGLTGCGPAYMYLMLDALADGGVWAGIPKELSIKLIAHTMLGSARMVLENGKHPAELKDEVCSPAGTSVQAIQALEKQGLRGLMMEAVQIASKRAAELSRIENGEKQDFALKRR